MTRRRDRAGRASAIALLSGLVVAMAACSTGPPPAPVPSAAPATPTARPTFPTDYRSIPVRVVHGSGGPDGPGCVVADVGVGYQPDIRKVTVAVDAGSSGLVVTPGSLGGYTVGTGTSYPNGLRDMPSAPIDVVTAAVTFSASDGQQVQASYFGAAGTVGVLRSDAALTALAPRCGRVQGVLGIAVGGAGPDAQELDSPFSIVEGRLAEGVSLTLSGDTGAITLGPVEVRPRSVVLPLTPSNGRYQNQRPSYQRVVTLCWTVGADRGCGPTTFGTGPDPVLRPDLLPTGNAAVPDGTPVSISVPDGPVLDSFTTGAPGNRLTRADPGGGAAAATGLALLRRYTVAYDTENGRAVLTPRG